MTTTQLSTVNGLDLDRIRKLCDQIAADPKNGIAKFGVTTAWKGGTRSETRVESWHLGGKRLAKNFKIQIDEPHELCGDNTQPNPQEYLMAALNACMMVGYVAVAALKGVELESVEIETEGELDLRGFLGLDPSVKPGYDDVHYTVRIKGNGTPQQYAEIHEAVMATSPNRWNIANPIRLNATLVTE